MIKNCEHCGNSFNARRSIIRFCSRCRKYADWRKAVFERDGYTCVHCGAKSVEGKRVRIEADHILQFATHPEKRFDVDNGRTLCAPCHRKTDTWGKQAQPTATGETLNKADV